MNLGDPVVFHAPEIIIENQVHDINDSIEQKILQLNLQGVEVTKVSVLYPDNVTYVVIMECDDEGCFSDYDFVE